MINIIENAPISVLMGVFYMCFGKFSMDDFFRNIIEYRDLPYDQKLNSPILKNILLVMDEIKNHYNISIQEMEKTIFLMNSVNIQIDRSFIYPKSVIKDKEDFVIIKDQKKHGKEDQFYKSIYFQKDALEFIPLDSTQRLVVIIKDSIPFISFTEEIIKGVTYAICITSSGAVTSNLSQEIQKSITNGKYKIDSNIIKNEKNAVFYKLIFIENV
jgi:hypothetical protein